MYATGGAEDFFFQRLVFLYPPKVHTNFHNPPSNQPKNEYPPPSSLTRNIKINICIIVHYICLKFQEFNENIERALTVYVIPMPASLSSVN